MNSGTPIFSPPIECENNLAPPFAMLMTGSENAIFGNYRYSYYIFLALIATVIFVLHVPICQANERE